MELSKYIPWQVAFLSLQMINMLFNVENIIILPSKIIHFMGI